MTETSSPRIARVVTTAMVLIDLTLVPADWIAGPLPNSWRAATGKSVEGSAAGRRAYINEGLGSILYRREDQVLIRWHKFIEMEAPSPARATLVALEVLRMPFILPFPSGILMLHFRLDPSMDFEEVQHTLNFVTNHNKKHTLGARRWVSSLVEPWATINSRHRRAQHATLITRASEEWPTVGQEPGSQEVAVSYWLFSLSTSGRYRPDPSSIQDSNIESPEAIQISMSDNLRGVVSRDGFVMAGLKQDDGGLGGLLGFDYDGAEFFTRGLYADVLSLSTIQRIALDALEYDLGELYSRRASPSQLLALETELGLFRTRIWRQDFAPQGSQDEVLTRLQLVQRLPTRESDLSRNISELSARTTRIEQNTIATLLRFLTLVGAFWGLAWALLTDVKASWRDWALAAILVSVATIVVVHPGLGPALGFSFRRREFDYQVHIDCKAFQ